MDLPELLPVTAIDPQSLLRDRSELDPEELALLRRSIFEEGLRMPIEVYPLADPEPPFTFGLLSGLRRLTACIALRHETIPAFIRGPATIQAALTAMVSENENRAAITPWEKGALIWNAMALGHFPTLDAAVAALYPSRNRQTHSRLRGHANVVAALDGHLTTPERLTVKQMDSLGAALRLGMEEIFLNVLLTLKGEALDDQWKALVPVIEHEVLHPADPRPGRPRMGLYLHHGLQITREPCRNGWILRFTGPEARKGGLVDDVLDEVERLFQKK